MISRKSQGPEIAAIAEYLSLDPICTLGALQRIYPGFDFLYYPKWISRLRPT
ncbi:MAG TPA: hypothetical protein VGK99_12835 [Acidobacteriota bacterium]